MIRPRLAGFEVTGDIMTKQRVFLKFWVPVLLWMVVFFSLSADSHSYEHSARFVVPFLHWLFPTMSQANVEKIHHVFRKCCHLTEYANRESGTGRADLSF